MTPILASKAKDITLRFIYATFHQMENENLDKDFDKWAQTPEAAVLLSGEDWKEDRWVSVEKKLPDGLGEVVVLTKDGQMYFDSYCYPRGSNAPFGWNMSKQSDLTHWRKIEPPKP